MALLLLALLGVQAAPGRLYHAVALKDVATTSWTHVCTSGPVVYVRRQRDGDVHITLDDGIAKVVLEIVPLIPLPAPAKGQRIRACGIARIDRRHGFAEIHPVEWIADSQETWSFPFMKLWVAIAEGAIASACWERASPRCTRRASRSTLSGVRRRAV